MYQAIYDNTTGNILAYCRPEQNLTVLISNYTNVDYINIDELPKTLRNLAWHVDVDSRQLIKE
jgi:hypothetical protein